MIQGSEDEDRFLFGRNGDNLMTPFMCELCHFRNVLERDPVEGLASDVRIMKLMRRANLDAFWSLEPSTVKKNLEEAKHGIAIASSLGFSKKLFKPLGPFECEDKFGMATAMVMLQRLLDQGKNKQTIQFDTVRKF